MCGWVLLLGGVLLLLSQPVQAGSASNAVPLKPHVGGNGLYALFKPADWKVTEEAGADSFRILVQAPDQAAAVDFAWTRNSRGQANALLALSAYRQRLGRDHPDVAVSDVYQSANLTHAVATVRYRSAQGMNLCREYFEATTTGLSTQGYCALEGRFAGQRPLLVSILSSLALTKAQAATGPAAVVFAPQYVRPPMVTRQAQDGSLSLKTPQDWGFLGAQGKVITASPDGGQGFLFTSLAGNPILTGATVQQGVIARPYLSPVQTFRVVFEGFGNRNVAILSNQPDEVTNKEFPLYTGRRGDAQNVTATWTSPQGASCQGFFKVINAAPSPTGLWFTILAGIWGPQQDFYRYFPLLEQVAVSFACNDAYARRYIQAGLENARRLHDKTVAMMRENSKALEDNQKAWEARQARKDYMDSKWDDYRRGNTYWVSDLEGGKTYQSDSWGTRDRVTNDYYEGRSYNATNFQGTNPNHPSETMREVSSYELEHMR
jgi:hypothetical protein